MKKLIILALSALMSFGAYAGNVRKSPNRSNNRAQRVSVQRNKAQSNRSWIEAAKSTAGVQFRSSVVNDLDFESINLPYFKDSVAFTTENGAQIAGAQRVKCYQFTVDKDTAIYVAAYNVNEIWGATFKISDEPFQSNYTPDDVISSPNPVKINISAGTHYVAFGDNNYYRTNFFASWLSISFKDEPVTAAAPVIRNSLYKEISLPYRNDSLAFTAENGAVKTQTGPSSFSNVLRYRITVPKDTSLYFQGYNSKYDHGISMIIRQSDINSGPYVSIPTTLTSEGATVDLPAGTSYISLSDDEFSGDEFFVTAFSIRAKGDTLKDVKSPVVYPVTPKGAITFKEISLPFNDSIFFNKANGAVYNGHEKLLGFKVTVPQDTAIKYNYSDRYGWGASLYASNKPFDASLDGLEAHWSGDKINLKAGVNYIAFGDDGFDGDVFYRAKVSIKLTKPDPIVPITFKEISLPYSANLEFTEENGAYNDGGYYFFVYKFTVSESGLYQFKSDYKSSSPVPLHISDSEFDMNDVWDVPFFGESAQYLEAGKTYYFSLGGDDGLEMQFSISLTDDIKEVTLPYYHDGTEFTEKFSGLAPYDMYYDIYTFTLTEDKDVYIYGGNVNAGNEFVVAISDRFFTIEDAYMGAPWVTTYTDNSEPKKVSLTAGKYYVMIADNGFASENGFSKYVAAVSFSYTDSVAQDKSSLYEPIPYTEITLPYTGTLEFTQKNTVKGLSWGDPAQLLGLKFTVDKDTTIYLQSKDTEHYGVSAYIDSCMITTDSIMAAPSHLKNLGYDFIDDKLPVSLKAGTYYIVLSDDGFGEHNSDYPYYSTVFSITFDENPDYLSVEEISKVGVEEGEADAVKAYGRRGSIIVSGAGDAEVKVFGANGAPIYSGNGDAVIPALPGIYAVRVADKAFKIVVR